MIGTMYVMQKKCEVEREREWVNALFWEQADWSLCCQTVCKPPTRCKLSSTRCNLVAHTYKVYLVDDNLHLVQCKYQFGSQIAIWYDIFILPMLFCDNQVTHGWFHIICNSITVQGAQWQCQGAPCQWQYAHCISVMICILLPWDGCVGNREEWLFTARTPCKCKVSSIRCPL
jgi:hypothetical protein